MVLQGDVLSRRSVLAKHLKPFSLIDCISVGVDRMQRNFEAMREQAEAWREAN
jgi:predicted HTH transcriptional regulator